MLDLLEVLVGFKVRGKYFILFLEIFFISIWSEAPRVCESLIRRLNAFPCSSILTLFINIQRLANVGYRILQRLENVRLANVRNGILWVHYEFPE